MIMGQRLHKKIYDQEESNVEDQYKIKYNWIREEDMWSLVAFVLTCIILPHLFKWMGKRHFHWESHARNHEKHVKLRNEWIT